VSEHERRFHSDGARLRAPERLALMEVPRVVALAREGIAVATVLDVGTGTGVFAEAFSGAGCTVTGLDPNPELLALARGFVPAAAFASGTAEKLPFADGSFDLVFLGHVLHETDEPGVALSEARRIASQRVAILEWPQEVGESGPPAGHRIAPSRVLSLAREAGFGSSRHVRLAFMDFYVLTP
jgi:ubiquinone/menaquinone biosynthesis C-methylase UbiE